MHQRNTAVVRFLAIVCALAFATSGLAQTDVRIEDVLKAWQERQERTKSLRVAWTEDFTETKGSLTKLLGAQAGKGHVPPADVRFQNSAELVLEEGKIRFRYRCKVWCESKQVYVDDDALHVFDGKSGKKLTTGGTISYPFGIITTEKKSGDRTVPVLRPILVTYRPTHPDLSPYKGLPYVVTGSRAVVQNRICSEMEVRNRPGANIDRLWVDPGRGYTVTRVTNSENEKLTLKIDIQYRQDEVNGWVPQSWEIASYLSDGSLHRSIRARVTAIEINPTVSKRDFDIEWPVGTYVSNENTGEDFIQKERGDIREVAKSERALPYETLASTPGPGPRRLLSWRVLLGAALLVAFGVLLAFGIWRQRRSRLAAS